MSRLISPPNGRGWNRLCLQLCLSWAGEVRFSPSGPTIDATYYWACSRWILTSFGLLQRWLSAKSDPQSKGGTAVALHVSHPRSRLSFLQKRCCSTAGGREKDWDEAMWRRSRREGRKKKDRKGELTAKPRDTAPRIQSTKSEIRSQKLEMRSHQSAKLKIGGESPVVRSGQATDSDDDTA